MSGNHKRKRRDMKRRWRYKATVNLIEFLDTLGFKKAQNKRTRSLTGVIRPIWDYVCRFESWNRKIRS